MRPPTSLQKLSGFTLIEVGIAAVLMAVLTAGALMLLADQLRTSSAQAAGTALASMNNAVGAYEAQFSVNLVNHTAIPIPGYANVVNPYSPTPAELTELGFLKSNVPAGIYGVAIDYPVTNGAPKGLVWRIKPFTDNMGRPSQDLAAAAMIAAGGDAAISTLLTPSLVVGVDGWNATNPVTSTAAIMAMRNGAGSAAYVRLDGSTPMQGSLSLNNFDLTNVGTLGANAVSANAVSANAVTANTATAGYLNATGISTANISASGNVTGNYVGATVMYASQNISASGNLAAGGNTSGSTLSATGYGDDIYFGAAVLYSDTNNSALRTPGALFVQNPAGTGYANVYANRLMANEYVQVNGYATAGTGCAPNGLIGQNGAGPLFCVNGLWVAGSSVSTVAVSSGNWQAAAQVNCPAGYNLTGGSCDMYRDGDGREISPRTCSPNGNGYYCNEGNGGTCIAHAICAN